MPCCPASRPPTRSAGRRAITPSPMSPAASASSTIRRSPRSVCATKAARVAILDVDLHHGNGTQGIFYARPDVLTVSLHADPARFYPFFWGHADERGEGAGLGYNLNLPLPRKSGDDGLPRGAGCRHPAHPLLCPGSAGRGARPRRIRGRSVRRAVGDDAGLCANRRERSPRSACRRSSSRKAAISATRSATI